MPPYSYFYSKMMMEKLSQSLKSLFIRKLSLKFSKISELSLRSFSESFLSWSFYVVWSDLIFGHRAKANKINLLIYLQDVIGKIRSLISRISWIMSLSASSSTTLTFYTPYWCSFKNVTTSRRLPCYNNLWSKHILQHRFFLSLSPAVRPLKGRSESVKFY